MAAQVDFPAPDGEEMINKSPGLVLTVIRLSDFERFVFGTLLRPMMR